MKATNDELTEALEHARAQLAALMEENERLKSAPPELTQEVLPAEPEPAQQDLSGFAGLSQPVTSSTDAADDDAPTARMQPMMMHPQRPQPQPPSVSGLGGPNGFSLIGQHQMRYPGAVNSRLLAASAPLSVRDAAPAERQLVCAFSSLHSKAVGSRGRVTVQEKPFSRVSWVDMKSPPCPICERCTSTLQKHFKNSTTSRLLCHEFLKLVHKVRCRVCLQWCPEDVFQQTSDFLCLKHATVGTDPNQASPSAEVTRQLRTSRPAGSSCPDDATIPTVKTDGSAVGAVVVAPGRAGKRVGRTLPYDPKKLTWNHNRTMNAEQTYCYCGQHKPQPSLRCSLCKNWYHRDCIDVLREGTRKYLPFQINYDFTCAVCSSSNHERYELVTCSWIDSILGAMGNLMWETQRLFFKVVDVADHLDTHWDMFCYRRERRCNWRGPLNSYFTHHRERFRQQKPYWGVAGPDGDELGPVLQPCRVLRGPARPTPHPKRKSGRMGPGKRDLTVQAVSDSNMRQAERQAKQHTGTVHSTPCTLGRELNAMYDVAAQLLLEADQMVSRQAMLNDLMDQHRSNVKRIPTDDDVLRIKTEQPPKKRQCRQG